MYSRNITISPSTTIINIQIRIDLTVSNFDYSKVKEDGGDIRFYDTDHNLLSYYIESWNSFGNSILWVKIPLIGTDSISIEYGNLFLSSLSNGDSTFVLFDDFNSFSLDLLKWTQTGIVSQSSGEVTMKGSVGSGITSISKYSNVSVRFYGRLTRYLGNAAIGGLYASWDDSQADFRMESATVHICRTRTGGVAGTRTDVTIPDYHNIYTLYEVYYILGMQSSFYVNDLNVSNLISNTLNPSIDLPVRFFAYTNGEVRVDWVHVRNDDGTIRTLNYGNEIPICNNLMCSLLIQ